MKVRELIEALQSEDPDADVVYPADAYDTLGVDVGYVLATRRDVGILTPRPRTEPVVRLESATHGS